MALVTKERTTYGRTAAARYETHGGHGRRHQRNEPRRPCTRFRLAARAAITALVVAIVSAAIGTSSAVANGVPFAKGDVLAGVGGAGKIAHFDANGKLLDTLETTSGSAEETGMCFDAAANLYSTNFGANTMSKFDSGGNLLVASFGSGFSSSPESCVFDGAGNVYVGQGNGVQVLKFNTSGASLGSFSPQTGPRGTDWVDLASDQCTLDYTSEGSEIKAFDVCTDKQLPAFATGLPTPCFAHRILAGGEELVACASEVVRLSSTGTVLQTYLASAYGSSYFFAMNIDPDKKTFWTADALSGTITRIDIATGAAVTSFSGGGQVLGLAIVGEITAQPKVELVPPPTANQVGSPYTFTAQVTEAGVPQNGIPVTFTVTGANPRTGAGTTNEAGVASFTYTGEHAGTDRILASFVDRFGRTDTSNEVTKIWTALPALPALLALPASLSPPLPPKKGVLAFKLSAPVLGKTVNVAVVSGVVFVKLPPGAHLSLAGPLSSAFESLSKGAGFIPLTEARQIPVGSTLDTTGGVARLTTATAKTGKFQSGDFGAGIFTILQNRKQRGLTNLNIVNAHSARQVCATLGKKANAAASKHLSSKVLGRLSGSAHGKFTTRGQYSAATVRGTIWAVSNRCDGTLTQVTRGAVMVRDFLGRKTITLFAGQHYLAKARIK
jgi:Bacterial Ig-like domain (group 1)